MAAIITAISGGLGIMCYCLPPVPCGVVAILLARSARRDIRDAGGLIQGSGLARAGEMIGWLDAIGGLVGLASFVWIVARAGLPPAP
jgi:hypothetical protein